MIIVLPVKDFNIFYVIVTDGDALVRLAIYSHDHRLASNNVVVVGWWQYWSVD